MISFDARTGGVSLDAEETKDLHDIAPESYVHTQSEESSLWTVNHNLGFHPAIKVLTSGGVERIVQVIRITDNQAQIVFLSPSTGTAHCS